jgi:hypothetical protein
MDNSSKETTVAILARIMILILIRFSSSLPSPAKTAFETKQLKLRRIESS